MATVIAPQAASLFEVYEPTQIVQQQISLQLEDLLASLIAPKPTSSSSTTFESLPTEIHMRVMGYLDPIDATCLGLTSKQMYSTYKCLHGKVPLNIRRKGPNTLEAVWDFLGTGAKMCRHCGIYRCELHNHIREFFPDTYEYCAVRGVYGLKPQDGSASYCFRQCPPQPKRCGRHRVPLFEMCVVEAKKTETVHEEMALVKA
jgi:hypothetical protein